MGAFTDLFGRIPRVAFLEALIESSDVPVSAPELARISRVSRRASYLFAARFLREGLIRETIDAATGAKKYSLNDEDLRARSLTLLERLVVLGGLEAQLRRSESEPVWTPLPLEALPDLARSMQTTQIAVGPELSLSLRPQSVHYTETIERPSYVLTMLSSPGELGRELSDANIGRTA